MKKIIKKRLCRICNEELCVSEKCRELKLEKSNYMKRFNKFRKYKTTMAKYKKKSCTLQTIKKRSQQISRIEKIKPDKKTIRGRPRSLPDYRSCTR